MNSERHLLRLFRKRKKSRNRASGQKLVRSEHLTEKAVLRCRPCSSIITGKSRYIVSRYLFLVIFLYPAPGILPFSLLPYRSIENCTAILSRASQLFKLYLCNTTLYIFVSNVVYIQTPLRIFK